MRILDQQEQQRQKAGERRAYHRNQNRPKRSSAFQDTRVVATRAQNRGQNWSWHRRLRRGLKLLRGTVALRLAVRRWTRWNVARWISARLSDRFRTVAAEIRSFPILSSASRTLHLV